MVARKAAAKTSGEMTPEEVAEVIHPPVPAPDAEPEWEPDCYIWDKPIIALGVGQRLEYYDGDDWYEVKEGRPPHVNRLRGHHPIGFPEFYVRADDNTVLLIPRPSQFFYFRIT